MISNFSKWTSDSKTDIDIFMKKYNSHVLYNHDFSLGSLDGYFRLFEDLETKKTFFTGSDNQILVMKRRKKVYVFNVESLINSDLEYLRALQKNGIVYSAVKLPLPEESKFTELIYDISHILDPISYKNSKQRNRKIKRPFNWFNRNKIEICEKPKSIEEVRSLHIEWVERKLKNPKTFKIFFPEKRYIYVFERFLDNPNNINYKGMFFYGNLNGKDELLSFRIISQKDNRGYDLTNIARYWCDPNVSNHCHIVGLKYLYDNFGIEYFYTGRIMDARSGEFKMAYPHTLKEGYSYSRIKQNVETKKLNDYY